MDRFKGSRLSMNADLSGPMNDGVWPVFCDYMNIVKKHGLDQTHLALTFCNQRLFVATSVEQLSQNIAAADVVLGQEVLDDIQAIYRQHPIPY